MQPEFEIPQREPRTRVKTGLQGPRASLFGRSHDFVDDEVGFRSGAPKVSGFKLVLWSWMATLIDALILVSMSCVGAVLFAFLMKTPAREVLRFMIREPSMGRLFAGSFLMSFWTYLVIARLFMGASIGEWACQLRLGQPAERLNARYGLRVMARTTLVLLSGVVVLPLVSLLLGRDLAGEITGIKIYSLT